MRAIRPRRADRLRHAALLLVALGTAPAIRAADERPLQASARLEPAVAGVDELVTFVITVESSGFGGVQVQPTFELDNLEIAAGPFQSRSQRWVNGVTSSSVQLTWRLRPKGAGGATVRNIRIAAGELTLELVDRRIEIQPESPGGRQPAPPARGGDPFEDLFGRAFPELRPNRRAPARAPKVRLTAEIVPADPFVGQQTTYTLWLYTQSDISAFQPTQVPDFRGFWVREIPQAQELRPEWVEIDGERFGRVPMLRRALFPLQEGRFTIAPTEADVVARVADIGAFGSPFGRNESLHLATGAVTVQARPLPPPGAGGRVGTAVPVGEIALSARLDRAALQVGQAATLVVRATGRGNLQSLAPPELKLPEGITAFPPRRESDERATDGALVSSTEWSYVLVPDRPGSFAIGPIEIPYFDPAARQYRQAAAAPGEMRVTGTALAGVASSPTAPDASPEEGERVGEDALAERRDRSIAERARIGPFALSRWWLWAGGGTVAFAALLPLLRRTRRGAGTGRSSSSRALRAAISVAAAAATPRLAAAELEEAWRAHLTHRWRVPPGTPVSGWADRLVAAHADPTAARELATLAHELHYLRYAPELSAADRLLADALDHSRRLARQLG